MISITFYTLKITYQQSNLLYAEEGLSGGRGPQEAREEGQRKRGMI